MNPDDIRQLWLQLQYNLVSVIAISAVLVFGSTVYIMNRPRSIYLDDYSCYKLPSHLKVKYQKFMDHSRMTGDFDKSSLEFQRKILERSGLGEETYLPESMHSIPPRPTIAVAHEEAEQDALVIKAPKKTPLILRMVVLLFTIVCGVYICLVCLKQINTQTKMIRFLNIKEIKPDNESCLDPHLEQWEIPYVHYPKPQTFERNESACNPIRYFVIMSMQRSWSGWFETLLNGHINAFSIGGSNTCKIQMNYSYYFAK